jgi:hypothetical protein
LADKNITSKAPTQENEISISDRVPESGESGVVEPPIESRIDPVEQLKQAFDAYLRKHLGAMPGTENKPTYRAQDWIWLAMILVVLVLVGSLIPETIFKDERYKAYFEKLLTWILAGGLLGKWVESPLGLLSVSRRLWFRIATVCCLVVCLFLTFDFVSVTADVRPTDATMWINNEPVKSPFGRPLRSVEVEIRSQDKQLPRTVTLSFREMISAGLRPTLTWRQQYSFTINCSGDKCSGKTADVALQDGMFDKEFEEKASQSGWMVREHKILQIKLNTSTANPVTLLAGDYEMTVSGCQQGLKTFSVPEEQSHDIVCN